MHNVTLMYVMGRCGRGAQGRRFKNEIFNLRTVTIIETLDWLQLHAHGLHLNRSITV